LNHTTEKQNKKQSHASADGFHSGHADVICELLKWGKKREEKKERDKERVSERKREREIESQRKREVHLASFHQPVGALRNAWR